MCVPDNMLDLSTVHMKSGTLLRLNIIISHSVWTCHNCLVHSIREILHISGIKSRLLGEWLMPSMSVCSSYLHHTTHIYSLIMTIYLHCRDAYYSLHISRRNIRRRIIKGTNLTNVFLFSLLGFVIIRTPRDILRDGHLYLHDHTSQLYVYVKEECC